jgi:alpha/beta superfamily hydrolase
MAEHAGYLRISGSYLYTVLHEVEDPRARVLLVGPFASERHNSYIPWVRWARYLAARGIEVLRYDYRGVGESTGVFEEVSFEDWSEDVRLLARWLRDRSPVLPLVLHGLEVGAVLAGINFQKGVGDALLLWAPPESANQALRATLSRSVGLDQLFKYGEERKSVSDSILQLETGSVLEVDGYQWSPGLWKDSLSCQMPVEISAAGGTVTAGRPVKTVKLGKAAAPLVKGGAVAYDEIKDFTWLFSPNFQWIAETVSVVNEGRQK